MPSTVDQIRQLLDKRDGLSAEAMRPLAAAYSEDVTRVNERLRDAVQLLRKGLRSEAIQRASLHPNAIEGAASLDFPEIEDWFEILQFLAIPVPPDLDRDAAEQLNEAIVETQPIAALLKQHRRLAIARAPLAWRLKILRRLAALDPTNSVWEEDLETWEEGRLKQVPGELRAAVEAQDAERVTAIVDELTAQSWRIEPDPKLIEQARSASNRFTHDAQTEQLRTLAPQLHEAFGQFNEPEARRLREEWRQIQSDLIAPLPPDLAEQAEPALLWLEEIDREADLRRQRAAAIGQLESALDAGAALAELQRAFHQTTRFDEPPTPELQQRYRIAVEERQLATKRKTQAAFAGIAAATLIVAAALGYWQFQSYQDRKVATAQDQFKALLDDRKIEEAEELWSRIESNQPEIAADTRLASLASELNAMLTEETSRATQFAGYLQQADSSEAAEIDLSALARAEKLAASEEEKAAAFRLRRRRSQWESEIAAQHSEGVATVLAEIRQQLDELESRPVGDVDSAEFTLLIGRLRNLKAEFPRRGSAANGQIELVRSRAEGMRDAVRDHRQKMETEQRAIKRVADANSLQTFAEGLKAFVRAIPQSPVADEFAQAASEKPLWDRALAWNRLAANLSSALAEGLTPDRAKSLLEQHDQLREDLEANPAASVASEWRKQLETVNNRTNILDQVFGDLPQAVIADLITVVDPNGTRYFVYDDYREQNPDKFESDALNSIDVVGRESGAVTSKNVTGPLRTIPEPRATVLWLSGLGKTERQAFLENWEGKFLKTMAELRGRRQLDGKVKEMLLFHLLEGACEGSPALTKTLAGELQLLRSRGEARKDWFKPDLVDNKLDRRVETKVVAGLAGAYRNPTSPFGELRSLAGRKYQWVGFLRRDSSGSVAPYMKEKPGDRGPLLIVRASLANPDQVEWIRVGEWQADEVEIDRSSNDLVAGRPLFYLSSQTTTGS